MKYLFFLILLAPLFIQCNQQSYSNASKTSLDNKEIEADNFSGTVEEKLAQLLQRQAGVLVTQTGSTYAVKIRGTSDSFMASSSPLYVIDGISIGNNFNQAAGAIAGSGIKSVRVLKGKDASFYGTRGSAGVIVIKTKKPSLSDK